jgi:starch phosphorylase
MPSTKRINPNPVLGKLSPSTNPLLKNDKKRLQVDFVNHLEFSLAKDVYSATKRDYYKCLAYTIRDRLFERWIQTQQTYYRMDVKRVYYVSMEYLLGQLLESALINLGLRETTEKAMWELGLDLQELVDMEWDAGLGNGGLGRLAACFLDSMATLELPAYGYGLRYEYGIFMQKIQDGFQIESPDHWLRYGNPWEIERPEYLYPVQFCGKVESYQDPNNHTKYRWINTDDVMAVAYDTPIPGYKNNTVNNLRFWSAKSTREFNLEYFNHGDYTRAVEEKIASEVISKVLYPRDDFIQGRELRLKQEYFLVSATLQDIIRRFKKIYKNFNVFPAKVSIQLNDTHPVLAIPELMRLLLDVEGLPWDKAWDITVHTLAYTNHTILQEALESWRLDLIEKLLPRHLQLIYEINHRFLQHLNVQYPGDIRRQEVMSIIAEHPEKRVRMANLAIIGSHTVNGVAELHTQILKQRVFNDFYELWPEKFVNKTNGITQRRWLEQCNPDLSDLITNKIGEKWIRDLMSLKSLKKLAQDKSFQEAWAKVKKQNKQKFASFVESQLDQRIDTTSLFDCQVKRIHEYKRQLLNILHVMSLYIRLKNGEKFSYYPRTFIFAGKAAPAYAMAKLIIKLIHAVAETIHNDKAVSDILKVIFLPNFSVSQAQQIIPAAELSEQISTAGMEASGTGNMKFALNGAITIGTLDGANIEIRNEVGPSNIFIFGLTAEQVSEYRSGNYNPKDYYHRSPLLKECIDLMGKGYLSKGYQDLFRPIVQSLLEGDYYMNIADFESYIEAHNRASEMYKKRSKWAEMSIRNAANMGKFSSDRTIQQYASEIWHVKPVNIKLKGDYNG